MPGETDLSVLLQSMQPVLQEGEYVFATTVETGAVDPELDPIFLFREEEGLTLLLDRERADAAGLPYGAVFRMITLTVYSSLEAVGFLAAVAGALAARGIGVNTVSAYFHDHLFVPAARAEEALEALRELSAGGVAS